MSLIGLRDVSHHFGTRTILEHVELQIERDERVCLVGRNGAGKTTLLGLIAGRLEPDEGEVMRAQGTRIAWLEQAVPGEFAGTAFDLVCGGLGPEGEALAAWHRAHARVSDHGDEGALDELHHHGAALGTLGRAQLLQRVEETLSRIGLEPDAELASLSAGMKRRALLARALVGGPDLLLLDEPTNHLDIEAIRGLEELLLRNAPTIIFVSHDRVFIDHLATRIVELDRGRATSWGCGYTAFLERREAAWEAEEARDAALGKKLAVEEAWLKKGVKARRTRNEGRVQALYRLREERNARKARPGRVRTVLQEAERSGTLVADAKDAGFAYGETTILRDFTWSLMRGDRVGIIGPNGSGKTTLLRVILGELAPQKGSVRLGTNLEIGYFDQLHAQLDEDRSVIDNVGRGLETVMVFGRPRHILGYLSDFLFTPERAGVAVSGLSGGERNRVLLARLLTRPANLLVLDEPTNDLDVETLEVLEEMLGAFQGTLLMVTHDRAFLDNVVTSTLALEGDGRVREYFGGYEDYRRQRQAELDAAPKPVRAPAATSTPREARPKRPTMQQRRELEGLLERVEALEAERDALHATMSAPGFYERGPAEVMKATARLEEIEQALADSYARWEELEAI